MRAFLVAVLVVVAALRGAGNAHADGGPFGLGLIVGKPSGLTGAYELSDRTAIDMALGIDLFEGRSLYVHADFLFLLPNLVTGSSVELSPYVGIGGFVTGGKKGDTLGLGARAPFGLSLDFRSVPLQLFAELVLAVPLIPDPDIGIGGAGGFRYYF